MAAGLGFKDFTTGEVLTAADVDGYLMQGVWVFASAAARDAAVTSPQEGNFAYLKDTNVTTYYTGSAWANLDTTGMTNPMTTTGDTIYSSSGSTPARLGIGTAGQVLQVNSGATAPEWAAPASASFVGTHLTKSVDQTTNNNTLTAITWDTETFDTDAFHSTVTNTSRITIPAGKAGYYRVTTRITFAGVTTFKSRQVRLYKNGSGFELFNQVSSGTASDGDDNSYELNTIVSLAVSDYLEIYSYQLSGSTLAVRGNAQFGMPQSIFTVNYLGA